MSRPHNPLSSFRSVSYYHVLVACDSSDTADELAEITKPEKWLHATGPNAALGDEDTFGLLGPFAVQFTDEAELRGRYCVLINGATDSMFSIGRAKWTSATGAAVTQMDQGTSIAIEGELDISEPKGIVFLDILVSCCLALGVDSSNVVYLLKTFFVGHTDTDNAQIEESYISDIEPLRFLLTDVTGTFAETGGLYKMTFVGLVHGSSRLPQFGKSASGLHFTGGTLVETIANLKGVVDSNYNKLYKCVEDTVKQTNDTKLSELLTRVKYEFQLDDVYTSNEYRVTDATQHTKDKADCNSPAKISIPANMSIEDALHLIMKQCPRVTKDASDGEEKEGRKLHYEYKIRSGVSSVRPGRAEQVEYTVIYRIQRFMRPKSVNLFDIAGEFEAKDLTVIDEAEVEKLTTDQKTLRNNLIAFDYMYTGKNIDILEFEMKLNMGLAYLQIATANSSLKEQLQSVPTAVTHIPAYDSTMSGRFGGKPTQIPVFFGSQIRLPSARNKQDTSASAEAAYSLAKHSSLEVQDVTMRIYGNPRLLGTINRDTSPRNIGRKQSEQSGTITSRQADYRDWGGFPSFAKINIKMPRNNDDISLFKGDAVTDPEPVGGADFTRDFWFTGFYYVVGMEHLFDGGEFSQVLTLIGIAPNKTLQAVNKGGENELEAAFSKNVLSCYDSAVNPCNDANKAPGGGSKVVATQTPPPTPGNQPSPTVAQPTTLSDAAVATRTIDPDKVPGWKTASPSVKQAIINASNKYNVDLGYMVAICQKESNFNAGSQPGPKPKPNPCGLFQFVDNTWFGEKPGYGIVNQYGRELGIAGKTHAEQDRARFDPRINAEAAALLTKQNQQGMEKTVGGGYKANPTDTYLAHFMGAPSAAKLIREPNQAVSVESVLGTKVYNSILKSNPQMAPYKSIAAWRAKVAQGMTPGVPIAQPGATRTSPPERHPSEPTSPATGIIGTTPKNTRTAAEQKQIHDQCVKAAKDAEEKKAAAAAAKTDPPTCNETPPASAPAPSNSSAEAHEQSLQLGTNTSPTAFGA